jgi:hypothetical protein
MASMSTSTPSASTVPVGLVCIRAGTHYKWEEEKREDFKIWWSTTEHSKGPDPNWGSKWQKTDIWQHFDECANIMTGEPALCCRTCHQVFVHPNVRRNGNSSPARHIHDCCAPSSGQKRGHQQSIADMVGKVCRVVFFGVWSSN